MEFRKRFLGVSGFERRLRNLIEENTDAECKEISWKEMISVLSTFAIILAYEHIGSEDVADFLIIGLAKGLNDIQKVNKVTEG